MFSGFMDLMRQGGWDMWLLLLISVVGLAVAIERLVFFAAQHGDTKGLLRQIGQKIAADDLNGAVVICQKQKGMLPRILEFGLRRGEKNRADITDALSIALMEHLNALERNLAIIGTIAVIAPFVGLFGTVLGIIKAFQDIALKGNSTPAVVAAGVSEALITTATGLIIAVIAVVFFNYFKSRIKNYNQEMIVAANQLAEMLHFHNTGAPIPTELYQPSQTGAK
ncbi:MAG: MotA/TolQ/ExbB proton channel family protein [Candidatus Eremiobacteraeota bacterium]|nr:MotA/TolQ/ExbB proton channel family protein [Candidatus Eremiobacteraeota bacterium]MBV8423738.1 MotA/TolQ/ExbB proton channel family protein [Candidatus Eremiobacteraeota bacterium]MBV8584493.1 MotA/TolQ/ExbB proton channel family protein [Candidatus Eremiobacteraeota bacterium]